MFRPAHSGPGLQFQNKPPQGGPPTRTETWKQSHQIRDTRGWEKYARKLSGDFRFGAENRPAGRWSLRCRRPKSFLEIPPAPAVALQEFVGLFRAPRTRCIVRKVPWRQRLPQI